MNTAVNGRKGRKKKGFFFLHGQTASESKAARVQSESGRNEIDIKFR